jgi:glycosyltransferase involved in cell wall biosynthesis
VQSVRSAGRNHPLVSVVMPCFNAGKTVDEAIESVLSGELADLELVAVDDGSQDDTPERLDLWAARDRRVRPITSAHLGIIGALNLGWRSAGGGLIARMDADDISHAGRLAAQVSLLNSRPDVAAVSCLVRGLPLATGAGGFHAYLEWLNRLVTPDEIAREIFVESPLVHPSAMIRRVWLDRMDGYQEHGWPEDYDLWLRMHLAGARFAKVRRVLFSWRERPERLTRTDSRYSVRNFLRAKAQYLVTGPLADRDAVLIWGAGQMGRRLSKHLLERGAPIAAFIDIDPAKIGRTKRGRPVVGRQELMDWWSRFKRPVLIAAVGSHGARASIREYLVDLGLREARDWWAAA